MPKQKTLDILVRNRNLYLDYALPHVWVEKHTVRAGTLLSKGLMGDDAGHAVLAIGSVTWCTLPAMLGTWRVMLLRQSSSDFSPSIKQ